MPLLSIIIPVYNEERTVQQVIQRVEVSALPEGFEREIIVINDGSTDQTEAILRQYEGRHKVLHTANSGKGGAVRKGLEICVGDYIVVQDADLEQNPNEFPQLLSPIISGKADVVIGSRFLGGYKPVSVIMSAHYLINKAFTILTNILTGYRTTDVWTGYKMYSRAALGSVITKLSSNGIEFELEVLVLLSRAKMRIVDVPISYNPRWYGEGKKTNWKQAVNSLRKLLGFAFRKEN